MSNKRFTTPTEPEVSALVALFSEQQFEAAEAAAKALIKRYPKDSFGFKALGAIYSETNRSKMAIDAMKRAIAIDPHDAELRSNLGNAYKDLRMLDEAEKCYKKALVINPGYGDVYSNYGVLLKDRGLFKEACDCYLTATKLQPQNPLPLVRLGHALSKLDKMGQAESILRQALEIDPNFTEAIHALALILSQQQRTSEASELYERALAVSPGDFELHNNHGNLLKSLGKDLLAEQAYRRALALNRTSAIAHNNLGMVLQAQNRAFEAEAAYRIAIAVQPDFPEAISNLGVTLMETGRFEEAERIYRHALAVSPGQVSLLTNLGCLYKEQGKIDDSIAAFRCALEIDPSFSMAASNLLFTLNHNSIITPAEMLIEAKRFGEACTLKASPYGEWRTGGARIKVGFVSGDFHAHPVGFWLENVLSELDRNSFELYAYSTNSRVDDVTLRIRRLMDKWTSVQGTADKACAQQIHDDGIDILIDLSGHTANNRLPVFAYKPAPIQATWLGYFATTGIAEIDYWICDPHVMKDEDRTFCTEEPWALPDVYCCLTPPSFAPDVLPLPALSAGYITFGCFNNLAKVDSTVVETWSKILIEIPGSRLFLKTKQLDDDATRVSMLSAFEQHGIAPERLIFEGASPRDELLAAYGRVDIALDPFPYPGGTTSAEAIWMGVPVLTKDGNTFLSRVGKTIITNAGLGDWVAKDLNDYVEKAVAFASEVSALAVQRRNMRETVIQAPLYDAKRFARHFGEMLKQMIARKEGSR